MEVAVLAAAVAVTTSPETFAAASDPDAGIRVAALYEAHARTIVGLCRFLLRDPVEAEDAAQQSFLSAYRSLLGGAVPREPAAWLAAIARNECWLRIKRRMREPLALHEVPSAQADPLEVAARNADFAALRAGLEALSRPQREAFLLREFAGLSYGELAVALGVTEPAVDSLLFRARTSLRRALSAANGALVPVALRDQLARLIPGFDQPATGTLAKLVSLPIAAKLAAAGAGAVLVVAGSAGLGRHSAATAHAAAPVSVHARRISRPVAARPLAVLSPPRPLRVASSRAPRPLVQRTSRVRKRATSQARARSADSSIDLPSPTPAGTDPAPTDLGTVPDAAPPPAVDGGVVTFAGGAPPIQTTLDDTSTDALTVAPTGSGSDDPGSAVSEPESSSSADPGSSDDGSEPELPESGD